MFGKERRKENGMDGFRLIRVVGCISSSKRMVYRKNLLKLLI